MEPLRCESIYAERAIKVICIGAGASGLLLAYKLNRHCRNFALTVSLRVIVLTRCCSQI
jgi:ribulose 1,5-bisphosphate synthetase/thiazole synthase